MPAGRLEHATHEPLISSVIVAEVPLAGLSLTELAKARLDASDGSDTHTLVRGLLKTYSTAGNMVWYSGVRDQLQKVVTPLAASSPKATAEASAAIQVWLKEAPKEENDAVFGGMHRVNAGDVTKRLAELTGKKP